MTYPVPDHCSERFEGYVRYTDCGPCSCIMLTRWHRGQDLPPCSLSEIQAFRAAAGEASVGPTRSDRLAHGLKVRYGIESMHVQGFPRAWSDRKSVV